MEITRLAQPKGSVMFFGLVLVTVLAVMTLTFSSSVATNRQALESNVAGTRALQLADSYTNIKIQQLWTGYQGAANGIAIVGNQWLTGTPVPTAPLPWSANVAGTGIQLVDDLWQWQNNPSATPPYPALTAGATVPYVPIGEGKAWCVVKIVNFNAGQMTCDVSFTTTAFVYDTNGGISRLVPRQIERVITFGPTPAPIYNYVYFANNFGWMYGGSLKLYGGMGANGNLGFSGNPTVDGPLFAATNSAIGAPGTVSGSVRNDSMSQYVNLANSGTPNGVMPSNNSYNPLMRPSNPAAPGVPYAPGYDGTQNASTKQIPYTMPYLSALSAYVTMAQTATVPARPDLGVPAPQTGGVIKQLKAPGLDPTDPNNYNILVNQTYGFKAGENGGYATTSGTGTSTSVSMNTFTTPLDASTQVNNGNLALIGTAQQPLVILGPVVISNDLVLAGVTTGQGAVYTGRNINVVGDVTYANPPTWTQNDFSVSTTTTANDSKDAISYAAKGNIVLGAYYNSSLSGGGGSWDAALPYAKPPFTAPYPVSPLDANIGYVTSTVNGQPTFHGDYTATDGGAKYSTVNGSGTPAPRRYYESSFSNDYLSTFGADPQNIQGLFYTNHYYGGRADKYTLYGTITMRDEGIVTNSRADFYYDARMWNSGFSAFTRYLPGVSYNTVLYHENSQNITNGPFDLTGY